MLRRMSPPISLKPLLQGASISILGRGGGEDGEGAVREEPIEITLSGKGAMLRRLSPPISLKPLLQEASISILGRGGGEDGEGAVREEPIEITLSGKGAMPAMLGNDLPRCLSFLCLTMFALVL